MTDPFALLGLPRAFALAAKDVERAQRDLSREAHPDAVDAAARRGAAERATAINEAVRALRDPVTRAEALFRLAGVPVGEGVEPKPSPAFLLAILEQREALADARAAGDVAAITALAATIRGERAKAEELLAREFPGDGATSPPAPEALTALGALRYYRRFLEEAEASLDALEG